MLRPPAGRPPTTVYTRLNYSIRDLLYWTRHETVVFVVLALVPVVLYEVLDQRWLRLPWLPIALVGTAVAFIISFQNNASYGRSWEARKIWGGITNTSRNWGMLVRDFVTNHFAERPAADHELGEIRRELVHRHVAWLTVMRHAMRTPRPWEQFRNTKTNREWWESIAVREHNIALEEEIAPFLPEAECVPLRDKANLAVQLLAIQSRRLRELHERGLLDDFRHMELAKVLAQLVDLQGASERIKNFPYPRQYATLNSYFVWIFILLLPFGVLPEFADIGKELDSSFPRIGAAFVWFSVPFSVIVCWVFHTMERIGRVTENPFEGGPNDVPISSMARSMEIDLRQILGEDEASIPEPLGPVRDTLM